jgi:hypothetical protein
MCGDDRKEAIRDRRGTETTFRFHAVVSLTSSPAHDYQPTVLVRGIGDAQLFTSGEPSN